MNAAERDEIFEELARRMRRETIPEGVRLEIREGDLCAVNRERDENSWNELEEETERLLRVYRSNPATTTPPRRSASHQPDEIDVPLSDYTKRRGEVFAEVIGSDPDVMRLRAGISGYPLSRREAGNLMDADTETFYKITGTTNRRRVRNLATRIGNRYGWRESQALRFLLTGVAPPPVRVAVFSGESSCEDTPTVSRIIITADSWVEATEVEAAFREAQTQVLGRDRRRVSERALNVVSFVADAIKVRGSRPAWSELLRQWNAENPAQIYGGYRSLRQVFTRFIHPRYERPKWKRRDPD